MKNCKEIKKNILLMEYDELDNNTTKEIKEHLKECKECNTYYNEIQKLNSYLNKYELEPSDNIPEVIKTKPKFKILPILIFKQIKYLLALLVIVLGISFFIEKNNLKYENEVLVLNKDMITIMKDIDFYENEEIFNNIEFFKEMDKYYEQI